MKSTYAGAKPFVTKDGSEIRELMHPAVHGNRAQSLAEATVPPGCETLLHRHRVTEELYHVTAGAGVLTLGGESIRCASRRERRTGSGTPARSRCGSCARARPLTRTTTPSSSDVRPQPEIH